jgi:hypothetical protein
MPNAHGTPLITPRWPPKTVPVAPLSVYHDHPAADAESFLADDYSAMSAETWADYAEALLDYYRNADAG